MVSCRACNLYPYSRGMLQHYPPQTLHRHFTKVSSTSEMVLSDHPCLVVPSSHQFGPIYIPFLFCTLPFYELWTGVATAPNTLWRFRAEAGLFPPRLSFVLFLYPNCSISFLLYRVMTACSRPLASSEEDTGCRCYGSATHAILQVHPNLGGITRGGDT